MMMEQVVPTPKAMDVTYPNYVSSQRTTLCDIMCTSNTPMPLLELPTPPEKMRPLLATLPYDKVPLVGPMKASTKFQKYKVDGNRSRLVEELKKDHEEFLLKVQFEKESVGNKKKKAATKIQAAFRGFKSRPKKHSYIPNKKPKTAMTQNEIQDELCKMAVGLKLKPIPGLNLEWRAKASKRKVRIETAAAYRMQKFFRMISARNLAKVVVSTRRMEFLNQQARIITRAIVYMKTKNFAKRVDAMKRERSSIKIQAQVRKFQAQARVRSLRRQRLVDWKRNDAAIVIQRNLAGRHRRLGKLAQLTLISLRSVRKMCLLVEDRIVDAMFEDWVNSDVNEYIELWNLKVLPALEQAEDICVDQVLESLVEGEASVTVRRRSDAISEQFRKAAELRIEAAELERMTNEEEFLKNILEIDSMVENAKCDISDELLSLVVHSELSKILDEAMIEIHLETSVEPEETEYEPDYEPDYEPEVAEETEPSKEVIRSFAAETLMEIIDIVMEKMVLEDSKHFALAESSMVHDIKAALQASEGLAEHQSVSQIDAGVSTIEPGVSLMDSAIIVEDPVIHLIEENQMDNGSVNTVEVVNKSAHIVRDILKLLAQGKYLAAFEKASQNTEKVVQLLKDFDEREIDTTTEVVVSADESDLNKNNNKSKVSTRKTKLSMLLSVLKLLIGRALFSMADYGEAKKLFDEVFQIRNELLGSSHYLVGESVFYLAEWYRAMAMYSESESMYLQADCILIEKIKAYPDLPPSVLHPSSDTKDTSPISKKSIAFKTVPSEDNMDELFGTESPHHQELLLPSQPTIDEEEFEHEVEMKVDQEGINDFSSRPGTSSVSSSPPTSRRTSRKSSSSATTVRKKLSHTIFKLYHRNMIAYTELLRQCGQYYKSYHLLKTIQQNLFYYKDLGYQSFEVREEFIVNLIHYYILRGRYNIAISLHQELLDKRRIHYGLHHPKIASSYYMLGKLYLLKANYPQAIQYIEDCLTMRLDYYPTRSHPSIAQTHFLKADGFVNLGHYTSALQEIELGCQIYQQLFDENQVRNILSSSSSYSTTMLDESSVVIHPSITYSAVRLYSIYQILGECKLAHDAFQQLQEDYHLVFYANADLHIHYLELQYNYAYNELFHYQNILYVQDIYLELIEKREMILQIFQQSSVTVVAATTSAATTEALLAAEEKEYLGEDKQPMIVALPVDVELMKFYYLYSQMHTIQIMEIRKNLQYYIKKIMSILTSHHIEISHCMMLLGEICKYCANYADAKTLAHMAYDIILQVHGEDHPMACMILLECADNLRIPGYYEEAMSLMTQVWRVLLLSYPIVPTSTATTSSSSSIAVAAVPSFHYAYAYYYRGLLHRDREEIALAEQCLLSSIHILLLKTHENCGMYARALGALADIYRLQGKYASAERLVLLAMSIAKNSYGMYSVIYLEIVMTYIQLAMDTQRWILAYQNWIKHVLPTFESLFGIESNHPSLLFSRVLMTVCKLMMEYSSSSEINYTKKSLFHNVTSTLSNHITILQFLQFWESSGFAQQHPWYRVIDGYLHNEEYYDRLEQQAQQEEQNAFPYSITTSEELINDSYSLSLTLSHTKNSMENDFDPVVYALGGGGSHLWSSTPPIAPPALSVSTTTPATHHSSQSVGHSASQSASQSRSYPSHRGAEDSIEGESYSQVEGEGSSNSSQASYSQDDSRPLQQQSYTSDQYHTGTGSDQSHNGSGSGSGESVYSSSQTTTRSHNDQNTQASYSASASYTASFISPTSQSQSQSYLTPRGMPSGSLYSTSIRTPYTEDQTPSHHQQHSTSQSQSQSHSQYYSQSPDDSPSPRSTYSDHSLGSLVPSVQSKLINIEESSIESWERSYYSSNDNHSHGGHSSHGGGSYSMVEEGSAISYQSSR